MGTPLPSPEPPYGSDCQVCTPSLWQSGKTPEHVYIHFSGITGCGWSVHPPPNGQTFKLDQVDVDPCRWYHPGSVWVVEFHAQRVGHDYSWIRCASEDGFYFFDGTGSICPQDLSLFTNDMAVCMLMYGGAGGYALLSYQEIALSLVSDFGLVPGSDLMQELFVHPESSVVLKFCDRKQRTNVKIRYFP